MGHPLELLQSRAVDPTSVRRDGALTSPRTFGVYELAKPGTTRKFRMGNHPVRQRELEAEFGVATLRLLFRSRADAVQAANLLNK